MTYADIIVVILVVVVLPSLILLGLSRRTGGGSHPARRVRVGMSGHEVRQLLGDPPGGISTGRDVLLGGSTVVGGVVSPNSPMLSQQFWLYKNTPPGNDTYIVVSGRGVVTSSEIKPISARPGA